MLTDGAAGPSGVDAQAWRKLCTSFGAASGDLCRSLAAAARRLCTCFVDPRSISAFLACRLIALSKNPGVRPIGIGETMRRIIAKAILSITKHDVEDAVGSLQLCAGQVAGIEAGVHATRHLFESSSSDPALLIDASNAFNSLNRQAALHNVQRICPSMATILINTYRGPSELFMDSSVLLSREGTTQGDPLSMPFYAIATAPLIKRLDHIVPQVWYADDAAGVGKLADLRKWWDEICSIGPQFGYFPNANKTWLVVKDGHSNTAEEIFAGSGVKITREGRPHLGAPLGTTAYKRKLVSSKVKEWCTEVDTLARIANTEPHAAYAACTHGLFSKWSFLSHVVPDIDPLFHPFEDAIRHKLLPVITGRPPFNDLE